MLLSTIRLIIVLCELIYCPGASLVCTTRSLLLRYYVTIKLHWNYKHTYNFMQDVEKIDAAKFTQWRDIKDKDNSRFIKTTVPGGWRGQWPGTADEAWHQRRRDGGGGDRCWTPPSLAPTLHSDSTQTPCTNTQPSFRRSNWLIYSLLDIFCQKPMLDSAVDVKYASNLTNNYLQRHYFQTDNLLMKSVLCSIIKMFNRL